MSTRNKLFEFFLEHIELGDEKLIRQLEEYFDGKRLSFDVDVELSGTDFQKSVWQEMIKIPYGETRTYQEIAINIGRPRTYRAVGNACNKNKLPVVIPCHRVVGSHGLGGYAFGLDMKKELLELEKNNLDYQGRYQYK